MSSWGTNRHTHTHTYTRRHILKVKMLSSPVPNQSTDVHTSWWKSCLWLVSKAPNWSCLITVGEVTVLPAANVDLLTLNPALTRHGIYQTHRKKTTYSCATWAFWITRQETVANGLKSCWTLNLLCHVHNCAHWFPPTAAILFCFLHFRSLELCAMKLCHWYATTLGSGVN